MNDQSSAAALTVANRRIRDLEKLVRSLTLDVEDVEAQLDRAKQRGVKHRQWLHTVVQQIHTERQDLDDLDALHGDLSLVDAIFDAFDTEERHRATGSRRGEHGSTRTLDPLDQIARCAPSGALTWLLDQLGDARSEAA